ncbi:MAG: saccharopine dehydrogenase C-terminal domain-containing protein [Bacteroidales bacterium]|nr:saccharopine dehydrogenase C-terminal domain-containing protein [Bacteroidales bacterium]
MSERKVLILGAGMVVKPIVTYLLNNKFKVTVATRTKSKADEIIAGHKNGTAIEWTVDDIDTLDKLIAEHDLTVSLLPYAYHVMVAKICITHKKNMVTTSYVKPEMNALDSDAKKANVLILNEIGLDPGIDHMSAMKIIDHVHSKGGKIEEFYSFCGALPAPEAVNNPFKYKFSWSPKGVVMAGNNDGKYLKNEKVIQVDTKNLFKNPLNVNFKNVGELQVYPNRDSLPYVDLYGVRETKTMMRGTFRYTGWCEIIDKMKQLNLISYDEKDFTGKTYSGFVAMMLGKTSSDNIKGDVAGYLNVDVNSLPIKALEWLGLFENNEMPYTKTSPFEITSDLMIAKMALGREERDMVVMQHTFTASYPDGKKEVIKSSMLDFGTLATDTAIARTVALPAAIAVRMILENKINVKGVHIPIIPDIYNPVLQNLEEMNIKMTEEYGLPLSDRID